jgi:small subunit ribosomal protein S20
VAHHLSAIKRIGTNKKANLRNRQYRAQLRTALRRVREAENTDSIQVSLVNAISTLDRLAGKGIIHANAAARKKSRLYQRIAKLAATPAA